MFFIVWHIFNSNKIFRQKCRADLDFICWELSGLSKVDVKYHKRAKPTVHLLKRLVKIIQQPVQPKWCQFVCFRAKWANHYILNERFWIYFIIGLVLMNEYKSKVNWLCQTGRGIGIKGSRFYWFNYLLIFVCKGIKTHWRPRLL